MKRDELIRQVKEKYASIAFSESQNHFKQTTTGMALEAYYEKLLQAVIKDFTQTSLIFVFIQIRVEVFYHCVY